MNVTRVKIVMVLASLVTLFHYKHLKWEIDGNLVETFLIII
jgi:hypothetical protein